MAWSGRQGKGASQKRKVQRHEEAQARIVAKANDPAADLLREIFGTQELAAHIHSAESAQRIEDDEAFIIFKSDARIAHEAVIGL